MKGILNQAKGDAVDIGGMPASTGALVAKVFLYFPKAYHRYV